MILCFFLISYYTIPHTLLNFLIKEHFESKFRKKLLKELYQKKKLLLICVLLFIMNYYDSSFLYLNYCSIHIGRFPLFAFFYESHNFYLSLKSRFFLLLSTENILQESLQNASQFFPPNISISPNLKIHDKEDFLYIPVLIYREIQVFTQLKVQLGEHIK